MATPMIAPITPTKTKTEFCGLILWVEHAPTKYEPNYWTFELYRGETLLCCENKGWATGISSAMDEALDWASEAIPELIKSGELVIRHKSEVPA